jgi:hypothetical protein
MLIKADIYEIIDYHMPAYAKRSLGQLLSRDLSLL